ncbi:type III secretion system chaperone [Thalassomonas viridans]|uniref:Type III secretion system chaperone n=1 Tax=Thalassomonas viridans TaxID=137584 RepID=A0AAF0C949_9GAMM|nr:type III secretion system chaperone [Thalassomonas viridans]WDE04860.1 type III secretion system chaperone [Thalassomonas viridans]
MENNRDKYAVLIDQVLTLLEIEQANVTSEGSYLITSDEGLCLEASYNEQTEEMTLVSFVHEITEPKRQAIYDTLLKANFACQGCGPGALGVSPEGTQVTLSLVLPLEAINLPILDFELSRLLLLSDFWFKKLQSDALDSSPADIEPLLHAIKA